MFSVRIHYFKIRLKKEKIGIIPKDKKYTTKAYKLKKYLKLKNF